jgi:hypothetical protein
MRSVAILGVLSLAVAFLGCSDERDEEPYYPGGPNGAGDDGATDDGEDDDGNDDGGDDGGDGGGDDGGNDDGGDDGGEETGDGGDDGGDTGWTDEGTTETDPPGGGDDPPQEPDCSGANSIQIPMTRDEMFCYVNRERQDYASHDRNPGCIWGGCCSTDVSWPYMMQWSADLTMAAQAEAEAVAGGQPPKGIGEDNGHDHRIWADGCATTEYTVTSPDDRVEHWGDDWEDAGLSVGNGTARMGVFYYDPGSSAPRLTRMGVGLAEVGAARYWVIKFGQ